jgi:hypothetical protein
MNASRRNGSSSIVKNWLPRVAEYKTGSLWLRLVVVGFAKNPNTPRSHLSDHGASDTRFEGHNTM